MTTTDSIQSVADLAKAKMPALVEFYNANATKPLKKFADIATARRRCAALFPKEAKPAQKAKAERAPKAPKSPADRSAAIAASWLLPHVALMRKERTGVRVKGESFPSVRAAFLALGLPLSRHIRFRMALKASTDGSEVFEHEGKKFTFTAEGDVCPGRAA